MKPEDLLKLLEKAFEFGCESISYDDIRGYERENNFADFLESFDKDLLSIYLKTFQK